MQHSSKVILMDNINWLTKKIQASKEFQDEAYREVNELAIRERQGRVLTLIDGKILVDFASCSYLGLDQDPRVIAYACKNMAKYGITFPIARTRIRVENFIRLEALLNRIFCNSYTVVFSSLHLTHLGILPLLGSGELPSYPLSQQGVVFILDKTVHSSIHINRALLGQFGHVLIADFTDKAAILSCLESSAKENKTPITIADGIGSMGGLAPVKWLIEMMEKYNGYVYFDDAHGTSILGKYGCGYVLDCLGNTFHPRLLLTTSLAKAFGSVAGVIAVATAEDQAVIKRFCPTYVFGGPPALPVVDAAIASAEIHLTDEIAVLQQKLWGNLAYFDSLNRVRVINHGIYSPIRCLEIGDEHKAIACGKELRKRGFAVTTAMYPTVAKGKSILRLAFSAEHTKSQIDNLITHIHHLLQIEELTAYET